MNGEYTLVVVDMQPIFAPSPRVIANVAREIELAKAAGYAVVFLEIPGWGWNDAYPPTYPELLALVRDYPRKQRHYKSIADGSVFVLDACRRYGFCQSKFRVCGLHTDACVLSTVNGLLRSAPQAMVVVVQDACHASFGCEATCWDAYPVTRNLLLSVPVS